MRNLVAGFPNGTIAVKELSIDISEGEHISLLGPSGCGKTTTLRCIAGLERPMSGEIYIDGRLVFSSASRVNVPPEARGLSMVFQSYAIWPHMTVFDNVAYGLRARKLDKATVRRRVEEALELVGLSSFAKRRATALSGGQQQRVALARAFVPEPKAMLLDEPLSNLDTRLRVRMRNELRELQHRLGLTTVYVTHDEEEAMAMSDRIVVMNNGEACQVGTPADIYERPGTSFVAEFVGGANLYAGALSRSDSGWVFDTGQAEIQCLSTDGVDENHADFGMVGIRSAHPRLFSVKPEGLPNVWPARISHRMWLGDIVEYRAEWAAGEMTVKSLSDETFGEGDQVFMHIPIKSAVPVRKS